MIPNLTNKVILARSVTLRNVTKDFPLRMEYTLLGIEKVTRGRAVNKMKVLGTIHIIKAHIALLNLDDWSKITLMFRSPQNMEFTVEYDITELMMKTAKW